MATARELAGAKLPGPTDGVSFVPLLEGRVTEQPLRASMVWPKTSLRFWKGERDVWAPVPQQTKKLYLPDAALLDEKWYALQLGQAIRLFDIKTDPGMKHDLSGKRPDLRARAAAEFKKLNRDMKGQPR
jgi:hypothetical protein